MATKCWEQIFSFLLWCCRNDIPEVIRDQSKTDFPNLIRTVTKSNATWCSSIKVGATKNRPPYVICLYKHQERRNLGFQKKSIFLTAYLAEKTSKTPTYTSWIFSCLFFLAWQPCLEVIKRQYLIFSVCPGCLRPPDHSNLVCKHLHW